ncbi:MAG: hypothetical protein Q7S38_02010 [bacterium]|nr:hypothetical protein [bacterium]
MFLQNVAVKTSNKESCTSLFKEQKLPACVSSSEGWVMLFPEIIDDKDDECVKTFLQQVTGELQTMGTKASVYDSDDFYLQLYDKGELVFDYMVDRMGDGGIVIHKGSAETLTKYAQKETPLKEIEKILKLDDYDKYAFVEDRYRDLLALLGMPKALGNWSYDYINSVQGEEEKLLKEELSTVEKI